MSVVGVSLATVSGQLVAYPNGAVAPYDPNNAAATKEHFAALSEAGAVVNPYFTHAQDLVVPAPLFYGYVQYGNDKLVNEIYFIARGLLMPNIW